MRIFIRAFIIFILVFPGSLKSQSYIPLLNDSMTWDNWLHIVSPACDDYANRAFISGDTVINSVAYKIISGFNAVNLTPMPCPVWAFDNSISHVQAYMREDSALQQVWKYDTTDATEKLLFDFTLQPGETFDVEMLGTLIVESVSLDSFPDGTVRKKIELSPPANPGYIVGSMIEGIGGSSGLYYTPGMIGLGFEYSLGCVFKNNIQLLPDPNGNPSYCPGVIGEMNEIRGKLFADLNSNMNYDSGDASIANKKVVVINNGIYFFTDSSGNFIAYVTDTGNFSVEPQTLANFIPVPQTHSSYFGSFQQVDSLNDFAFQPVSIFNDMEVSLFRIGPFRPGLVGRYLISYQNSGTTIISPGITFNIDPALTYSNSSVTPSAINGDTIVWNLPDCDPFEVRNIFVDVLIDSTTALGTPLTSTIEILPLSIDSIPVNNFDTLTVIVSNSFDPNDILVDRDSVEVTELYGNFFLNYMIRFQNSGNDTAFNVRIENPINYTLAQESFELTGYSHPVQITWNSLLHQYEFNFANINLPDSNINEPASHGFISYRISPYTGLTAGNLISNTAEIFFDMNVPVNAGIAITKVVEPLSIIEISELKEIIAFPNPVFTNLNIKNTSENTFISNVNLITIDGRIIYQVNNVEKYEELNIDLSSLANGIYFLHTKLDNGKTCTGKIIKL